MPTAGIEEKVESLSLEFVLTEQKDLRELAGIHTLFEDIGNWASGNEAPEVAQLAQAAADLVERIILEEVPDQTTAYNCLGRAVMAIQKVVCHGRSVSEAEFPPELMPVPVDTTDEPSAGEGAPSPAEEQPAQEADRGEAGPRFLEADPGLLADFVQESNEHLDAADVHLLTLESDPENEESLNAVFRAFHTIKGVAGFLALDEVQELAHEEENLLDRARKNELTLAGQVMDITFSAVDALKTLVGQVAEALGTGEPLPFNDFVPGLIRRIRSASSGQLGEDEPMADGVAGDAPKLGEMLVESGAASSAAVEEALNEQGQPAQPKKVGEILVDSVATSSAAVEEALEVQRTHPSGSKTGEIMVEMGTARQEDVDAALAKQQEEPSQPRLGQILVEKGETSAKEVVQALRAQRAKGAQAEVKEAVKVEAGRLDLMVDTIGELVIAESMVSQSLEIQQMASPELVRHLGQLGKITRELQEMGMSLRMVPVRATFQKMARLARDVAKKAGKEIEFVMSGEDTEVDKSVVDRIGDPLVHMIRNAVDHGLEHSAEDRVAAGKPPKGKVQLSAFHKGGGIHIEVIDDGRGMDRDVILAKAVERGLASEGESLSDKEVWNLIFEPGFSTAREITDVSGRGVGMDVVKRNIEALRGQVEIHSEEGKGSVFSIRLPLTLAIIDGMVVRVDEERYVIPTLSIVTSLRPRQEDLFSVVERGEMMKWQDSMVPLFQLDRLFGAAASERDLTQATVVVVEAEDRIAGLAVDEILGQQQIVIKSLGSFMQSIPGVAGGAIMGDGRVGMILDAGGLVRLATDDGSQSRATQGARRASG